MSLPQRVIGTLVLGGTALALVAGVVVGIELGTRWSRPATETVRIEDPSTLAAAPLEGAVSPGGFTGFGGPPALPGDVFYSGVAGEVASGGVTIEGAAAATRIEYTSSARLYAIVPLEGALRVGDSVVVRLEDGRGVAVLRVDAPIEGPAR